MLAGLSGNKKSNQIVRYSTFAVNDKESNFLAEQTFFQLKTNEIRPFSLILQPCNMLRTTDIQKVA